MNTTEHIVESYFRLCRRCFTISDVKVPRGNNRQIDLLAVSLIDGLAYHVECSVTHKRAWCPTVAGLELAFVKKFSGVPPKREGRNTDSTRNKRYGGQIFSTYRLYGIDLMKVRHVWVCWEVADPAHLDDMLNSFYMKTGIRVEVISFRDAIIPELQNAVGTAHYDDDILRTFSLLKEFTKQRR
jgi:hypothetical protein